MKFAINWKFCIIQINVIMNASATQKLYLHKWNLLLFGKLKGQCISVIKLRFYILKTGEENNKALKNCEL